MKEYLKTKNGILYQGDCLDVMEYLSKKNIKFDLILTDPPYGTTACKWDFIIPFDKMWFNINSVINDNTAICLFGSEPFSSKLRLSNLKYYRYDWFWNKKRAANILVSGKMPLKIIENINVFYKKISDYYPQKTLKPSPNNKRRKIVMHKQNNTEGTFDSSRRKEMKYSNSYEPDKLMPTTLQVFNKPRKPLHPTQKPVDLYKYLIKTYTKENDIILDFCAGSGTLAIACHDLNRRFIMIEKEIKYCEVIKKRLIDNKIKILNNKVKLRKRV